jgi:hypothetical protein
MLIPIRTLGMLSAIAVQLAADPIQIAPQAINFFGPTAGVIRPLANYTSGGNPWVTTDNNLVFDSAGLLAAQGLENPFMQALSNNLANGWSYTFNTTAVIADNTFQVHTYAAQAPRPPASNDDAFTLNGSCPAHTCTGSQFVFNYVPTGDDPTANIHWVQILYDNYLLNGTRVPPFYEIDNDGGTVPYYDVPFFANSTGFRDTPRVTNAGLPTTFDALALAVTGPPPGTPGQFTIYGGIEWGWSNAQAPEPSTMATMLLGLAAVCGIARTRRARSGTRM